MVIKESYQSVEDEKRAFEYIDKIIEFFPKYEKDIFASLIHRMDYKDELSSIQNIGNTMLRLNIFEKKGDHFIQFSPLGREIKDFGNYSLYLEHLTKLKNLETYKQKKEIKNLESPIKINKWLLKTKWLPHIFSVIALIISLIALLT